MDIPPAVFTMTRRAAIASALGLCVVPSLARASEDDEAEIASIRARGREAGLGDLSVEKNDDYLAIGDSPEAFRKKALQLCLGLARDFLKHFGDKGFRVEKPRGRMSLVVLSGRAEFTAYLGEDLGPDVAGIYDPDTNRLLLFDNRSGAANPKAAKTNTMVLFHEATHQLTFSAGLLDKGSDVPLAIAEGLGTYGEVRSVDGRMKVGQVNHERLNPLVPRNAPRKFKPTLTSVSTLIGNDQYLESKETEQIAYSECWLLVHFLMNNKERLPQFRAYLKAIRTRQDASARLDDWAKAFGDPKKMDLELQAYAVKLK